MRTFLQEYHHFKDVDLDFSARLAAHVYLEAIQRLCGSLGAVSRLDPFM